MRLNCAHIFFSGLALAAISNAGTLLYNNLGDPLYINSQLTQNEFQSFTSGSTTLLMDDLKLELSKQAADSGIFAINLYSDNLQAPGTLLLTIGTESDTSLSTTVATYDFSVPDYSLTANARYWIGLIPVGSIDGTWEGAHVAGGDTGTSGQFIDLGGSVYPTDANYAFVMSVDAVAQQTTPEPSSAVLLAAGLGIAAWKFKAAK